MRPSPRSPSASTRLSQISVLVVDDDNRIATIVRKVLESLGFAEIHTAKDGKRALEVLRGSKIDIVITDWHMHPVDGVSLIKHLRISPDSPNRFMPIIMLTGNADREHVETARDIGVTEFVVRPFSAKTLCDRIVALIESPRPFIMGKSYVGPDRRRRNMLPPDGIEKRRN